MGSAVLTVTGAPIMCVSRQVRLPLGKDSFPLSRRFAYTSVAAGLGGNSAVADDVALVVNELVTSSYLACADVVDMAIELHWDHVTVVVRDDRPQGSPAPVNETREQLLDAITISRSAFVDRSDTVAIARIACSSRTTKRVSCGDRPHLAAPPRVRSAGGAWTVRPVAAIA
jgi:hypothetical protein